MTTAIALLRVSTPDQVLGLEAQRADIERYAREHGIDVLQFHTEIVSGGAELQSRPGLLAASDAIATTCANHLLVAKRDRLSRDPLVAMLTESALRKLGATVLSADGNNGLDPASTLIRHVLYAVAEYERRMIGIRTKAALAIRKAKGLPVGKPKGAVDKVRRKPRKDKGIARGAYGPRPRKAITSTQTFHSEPGNA